MDPENKELVTALAGHFSSAAPGEDLPPDVIEALGDRLAQDGLLRRELVAFWKVLGSGLTSAGYQLPSGGEVRLMNLACGPCIEAAVLSAFFGQPGAPGGGRNTVRFFGMDLRGQEIEKAQRRYAATESLFRSVGLPPVKEQEEGTASVEFFADDATRLVGYKEIPKEFDIVFLRHQNVWHDRPVWRKIFAFGLDRLAHGGLLIITSYFDREHMIALDAIKGVGGRLITSVQNPDTVALDYPGKSSDRHLAVFGREQNGALIC